MLVGSARQGPKQQGAQRSKDCRVRRADAEKGDELRRDVVQRVRGSWGRGAAGGMRRTVAAL
eukprot:2958834-Pleurochrysis_carterae.AAC.2